MWIASKFGFFSIVHKEFRSTKVLSQFPIYHWHVRARKLSDLNQLLAACGIVNTPIHESTEGDYAFRILVGSDDTMKHIFSVLLKSIDYDNFKDMIHHDVSQYDKSGPYNQIWGIMRDYQDHRTGRSDLPFKPKRYTAVRGNKFLKMNGALQDDQDPPPRTKQHRRNR